MEKSLVLIKPDGMQRRLAGAVISRLEGQGLRLAALKMLHLDEALAKRHYAIHAGKPFFRELINYITSTPIVAVVFKCERAVEVIRKAVGATDPTKAEAGTIRAEYGSDIQRNVVHGHESVATAETEVQVLVAEYRST